MKSCTTIQSTTVVALIVAFLMLCTTTSTSHGFVVVSPTTTSKKPLQQQLHLINLLQQNDDTDDSSTESSSADVEIAIPYIIDRVTDRPNDRVFDEIAGMCIEVFFNDSEGQAAPWKNLQLGYLRGIQSSDLRRRRTRADSKNEMLVARRVIPMDSPQVAQSTPLILDWDQIYNLESANNNNNDYVRGEILGFCEVTERAYGLGDDDKPRRMQQTRQFQPSSSSSTLSSMRPILTNLSVKEEARKSGIGSQLVQACEAAVATWGDSDGDTEIILEVESDNDMALAFYQKRGYTEVFTDPACRRYTTKGFFLGKERCSKICMRKALNAPSKSNEPSMDLSKMLQSFRESVFS